MIPSFSSLAKFNFCLLLAFALALLAGCGGNKNARVKGTLLKNGQPYVLADKEIVQLLFESAAPAVAASADLKPDGSFEVVGPTGEGMPLGTYKIGIVSTLGTYGPDQFANQFSIAKTPLSYTFSSTANEDLVIDVTKKTAAKKTP